jgi:hypothetical protein
MKPTNQDVAAILGVDQEAIKAREVELKEKTDAEIIQSITERFKVLGEVTKAVRAGDLRAVIVSGPPGVGKSFIVEEILSKDDVFDIIGERKPKYEVVKGAMSALGLYAKLFEFADEGSVVVFDDCDSILLEDLALNILKGALDSSKKRFIAWNTDSRLLRTEGIPNRFEFKGAAIFITNIKFAHVRSKKIKDHLAALESRCHYIDLEMDTMREKILRIKQIVGEGMLDDYKFRPKDVKEILKFIEDNKDMLRELSLRMVLKISDLRKSFPATWMEMSKITCMRRK